MLVKLLMFEFLCVDDDFDDEIEDFDVDVIFLSVLVEKLM